MSLSGSAGFLPLFQAASVQIALSILRSIILVVFLPIVAVVLCLHFI